MIASTDAEKLSKNAASIYSRSELWAKKQQMWTPQRDKGHLRSPPPLKSLPRVGTRTAPLQVPTQRHAAGSALGHGEGKRQKTYGPERVEHDCFYAQMTWFPFRANKEAKASLKKLQELTSE